ncbi:hypothetical protein Trydic_g12136 [Trypoxylus dichotomus]
MDCNSAWPIHKVDVIEPLNNLDEFEPQIRPRCMTWPQPRPKNYIQQEDETGNKHFGLPGQTMENLAPVATVNTPNKNKSNRRNAWGNLSYADLITQAIMSSPEKRLTLSQIYEWIVQNIPHFKDKGNGNSSVGWKNSIRHNLSLYNRFVRVQNETTSKSSWWMINLDARKSIRRRTVSMETSTYENQRGRVKWKVDTIRNALVEGTCSPNSSLSDGLDVFRNFPIHNLNVGPDFEPRPSERLPPIPAVVGMELDGSASQFATSNYSPVVGGNYSSDQLADNLQQGMKLESDYNIGYLDGPAYTLSYGSYSCRDLNASHATSPYGLSQYPIHRLQISDISKPPSNNLSTTPQSAMRTTMMGVLNSSSLDDIHIEPLQGGFDCNVDEIIKYELSMEGCLDFNFADKT